MSDIFSTVEVKITAEPEVLITSLLQRIETSLKSRKRASKLVVFKPPRPRTGDTTVAEYPRWQAIIGSGDNLCNSPNVVVVLNAKQAYA